MKITLLNPFGVLVEPQQKNVSINDVAIGYLRKLSAQFQLVVVRGFNTFTTTEGFSDYCEGWGAISVWPFGKVLELLEQENPQDHIFDNSYVPLHWDGMYRPQIPELQIFHCVVPPLADHGGRTTFSNTISALQNAPVATKALWHKITGIYERKMEFYSSKTISPIISKHPYKDFSVIRYNEPPAAEKGRFINPPLLEFTGADPTELSQFHQSIQAALYASNHFYAHEWQKGDVVIADNFSLLHGREAFVARSPRHIQRVHVLSEQPFANPGLESYQ
jgi:alpha-ketoglutarate-dependent taurine dioxygenase